MSSRSSTLMLTGMTVSAIGGAVVYAGISSALDRQAKKEKKARRRRSRRSIRALQRDPETDPTIGHELVWSNISGAMASAMLYVGDRLNLYETLMRMCSDEKDDVMYGVTAIQVAEETGLNQLWLREWLAQQAALGVLKLLPPIDSAHGDDHEDDTTLRYRLPKATAQVLADPSSKEYDISMIKCVPSLVNHAKAMLPHSSTNGFGKLSHYPSDIVESLECQHRVHVRDIFNIFIPEVVPAVQNGRILEMLENGCEVADLGCGGGALIMMLAEQFPNSTFHGYEVDSDELKTAERALTKTRLSNVFFHNANKEKESLGYKSERFDIVLTFDILHDVAEPVDLIAQVRKAIKPQSGVWLLADIISKATIRKNIAENPTAKLYFAFSTCLCMSCSLSKPCDSAIGKTGFTVPVAKKMLAEGGFHNVDIVVEKGNARWFVVS